MTFGQDSEIEEEMREKMKIEKRWDIYMTNEGKVVGWRDLEEVRDGGMVEIGLRMRGAGKKKKETRSGKQRENLVGGESTGSEETENSTGDEAKKDAVFMSKAKVEGGPMHEMIETLAGMLKEEVMKDGMKKGVLREGNSPDEIIDFGKHVGKTFSRCLFD